MLLGGAGILATAISIMTPSAPLGITVRTGYLLPSSGKDACAGAFAFGASYTLTPQESRLSYEFGIPSRR